MPGRAPQRPTGRWAAELAQTTESTRPCCSIACRSGVTTGPVKSRTTPPPSPASWTSRWARPAGSANGVLEDAHTLQSVLLRELDDAVDEVEPLDVRRDDHHLALGPCPSAASRAAEARVVGAHVDGGEVRALEAGLGHAGDDQVVPLLGVVVLVHRALDEAGAAHDPEHLVLLDELAGETGDLLRIDLLLFAMYSIGRPLMPPLSFTQSK